MWLIELDWRVGHALGARGNARGCAEGRKASSVSSACRVCSLDRLCVIGFIPSTAALLYVGLPVVPLRVH